VSRIEVPDLPDRIVAATVPPLFRGTDFTAAVTPRAVNTKCLPGASSGVV